MKMMCLAFSQFACQALVFAAAFLRDSRIFVSALSSWMFVTCNYPRSLQLTKEWEEKMPKIQTEQDMLMAMVYALCFLNCCIPCSW